MSERFTQQDADRINARRRGGRTDAVDEFSAVEDESELHNNILAECRQRGWLALHGSMTHKAKRTAGEPDFVILTDSRIFPRHCDNVLFVECKSRAGKLSTAQQALHAHARKLGHEVHVVRSFREFLALL